jgi:bifunctional N-acetylglucosamine-1-phosphate-uridyltransferase/glucosamine-1-phosphate-acetyltransferase GlmU-like protein
MRTYGLPTKGSQQKGDWLISFLQRAQQKNQKEEYRCSDITHTHNKKPLQVRAFIPAHLSSLGDNMKDTICIVAAQP